MTPIERETPPATAAEVPSPLAASTIELKDKLKAGEYDGELKELATRIVDRLKQLGDEHRTLALSAKLDKFGLDYLTALAWSAEVLEYFGNLKEGTDIYALVNEEGPRAYADIIGGPSLTTDIERRIAREEVWVAVSWVRGKYRVHKYNEALQIIEQCEMFVETKLQRECFECNLTLATVWSLHAKILRQLVRLQEAKVYYDRALSRIYRRSHNGSDARFSCEVAHILAFGHGWILYTQGLLQEARAAVSTALVILKRTDDVIYKAYGELLLCSISRAMIGVHQPAGIDQPSLSETIKDMQQPYQTFKQHGHESYAARAAYELALSYLYRGLGSGPNGVSDFTEAEKKLSEVLNLDDTRWQANAWVVMSRLQRGRADLADTKESRAAAWEQAEKSAKHALRIAMDANLDFCKIDAHIALGEVFSTRPDGDDQSLKASLDHFRHALDLAVRNPKPSAVCHIHMAKVHLLRGNLSEAQAELAEWRKIEPKIQHGFVREFGKQVAEDVRLAEQKYFVVDSTKSLNIAEHTRKLVRFLLTQARAQENNLEHRLLRLGVKRATYYNLMRRVGEMRTASDEEAGSDSSSASQP